MKGNLATVSNDQGAPQPPAVFISVNPATGKELSRTEPLNGDAVEQALARAEADQAKWAAVPVAELDEKRRADVARGRQALPRSAR